MKPAAKSALQFMVLGVLVFTLTVVGSATGFLQYCPEPFLLPDGGMKPIFREDVWDGGEDDAGIHDVTPELELGDDGGADSGVLSLDSEPPHTR